MLTCFKFLFTCFERILFYGFDEYDEYYIENKFPFSENNTKSEIDSDCNLSVYDSSSSSDEENNFYNDIIPFQGGYKITRRNMAFGLSQ